MNISKINFSTIDGKNIEINFSEVVQKERKEKNESTYSVLLGNNGDRKTACLEAVLSVFTNRFNTGLLSESSITIDGQTYTNTSENIKETGVKKVVVSTYSPYDRIIQKGAFKESEGLVKDYVEVVYPRNESGAVLSLCSSAYLKSQINVGKQKVINELSKIIGFESKEVRLDIRNITKIQGAEILNKIRQLTLFEKKEFERILDKRKKIFETSILKSDRRKLIDEAIKSIKSDELLYQFSVIVEIKDNLIFLKQKYGQITNHRTFLTAANVEEGYKEKYGEAFKKVMNYDLELLQKLDIHLVNNLFLTKKNHSFYLSQLSSGEFALFIRLMEIEAVIENNSIVLIDEPETHLNPKWIFIYMNLLKEMFDDKNSVFIIASQSPFIVGSLTKENIYSLKSNDGIIYSAETETFGASYDDILKNIFDVDTNDNMLLKKYTKEIRKKSKEDMLEALDMTSNIAETRYKENLLDDLLSKENIDVVQEQINKLRSEIDDWYK